MIVDNSKDSGTKNKIIVVENELIVAKNIENQLFKLGYEVVATVDSGEEAVRKAAELLPDLVLMDINLAGEMDGVEAAQIIGERFQIPVVYLTAFADAETLQRAKITEPFGYVIKPFELKKLHSTIEIAMYKYDLEKKLKDSELRFRTLATSSPVGIFQTDINGDCNYVNTCWCNIAGISSQQAIGTGWLDALYSDDREMVAKHWNNMIRLGDSFNLEYRFQTPSGKTTWVFGQATALKNDAGEKIGYIGTITDITLRKNLEEELLTAKKLESIGILAGGIAHDFNNLLSIILGNISMLKSESNITLDQVKMLKNAENASIQAAELAQKLITFSKGGWLDRKRIPLNQFFQDLVKHYFRQWEEFFSISIPENTWLLDGDPNQLKQVFKNIIENALDACDFIKKGDIKISACNEDVKQESPSLKIGRYVKIIVKDKGIGISKKNLEKVFDPYFTTKFRGIKRGLGLGLTICYSIVLKHEGHIQISSEPGKGTAVYLYIPAIEADSIDNTNALEEEKFKTNKALVVEGEKVIQDVTRQMLLRLDFEVVATDDGIDAVKRIQSAKEVGDPFNVMLFDLKNKKSLHGKEVLNQVKSIDPNLVVIAVSGFSDISERQTLLKFGFSEVLFKPFKLDDLKKILEKVKILG